MTTRMSGRVPHEAEEHFPLADGRRISVSRGMIACEYGFSGKRPRWERAEEDCVASWLEVCDIEGRRFRLEREIPAHLFLELVRLSRPVRDPEKYPSVLENVRCYHDGRSYIPTVSVEGHHPIPFSYFSDGLEPRVDLLRGPSELVIRVHAVRRGAIGGGPVPEIVVATDWGPILILWPSFIHGAVDPTMAPPVFVEVEGLGEVQPTIKVL